MAKDNVYIGEEARDALMRGVNVVADAVKQTLGAKGSNAVLAENEYPFHIVTNDGISIARKVHLSHPVEQMGANIMREVADRANKESGDGTTTAMTLTQAILVEGAKATESAMEVKRSLDECLPVIMKSIDDQKKLIETDEVAAVASISAEDEQLGAMLQEIYKEIGKDGIIELDVSGTFETKWELTDGVRLRNAGFMSHYMANDGQRAVYKKPRILIAKQKITTLQDIDPLFREMSNKGKTELVIFVDDIDASVLHALALTHVQGIFKTLIIKAPMLWKDWLYEDFAAMTGATIVEPLSGVSWKNVNMTHLGVCEQLTTTKEETIVVGIKDITEHVKRIESEGTDDSKLRASWLQTKAATLKLGANSESELSYKRLKAEDARNASYLALQDGVVAGGGVALRNAVLNLPDTVGGRILKVALRAPIQQIIKNAGITNPQSEMEYEHEDIEKMGFDARTNELVDMWEAGILDPARVVKNSVKNAISVAGIVLTTRVAVCHPSQEKV